MATGHPPRVTTQYVEGPSYPPPFMLASRVPCDCGQQVWQQSI